MAVLYRKYRPTQLEDVVGQKQVTSVLSQALKTDKLAHAYLFIGPRGTGKTSVARIFAHAVNGFDYQVEDSYLDIIEIDAASNTGVDNIRELREKAVIAPTAGKYKVYIIDEVHMLTKSASNALLKTLEEPPEHVIFIMATTDAYKVPITISSRTQVHTFKLADPETMFEHLRKIADQEKIQIDDDALKIVVQRGGGSFRDSLSLLDQISSLSDQMITAERLSAALGLPATQATQELLENYATGDSARVQSLLRDLLNSGIKPETIAGDLIAQIIAAPSPATLGLLGQLPGVQPPFPEAKLLLALLTGNISTSTPAPSVLKNPSVKPPLATTKNTTSKNPISSERPLGASRSAATPKAPSDQALAETAPETVSADNSIATEAETGSAPATAPTEAPQPQTASGQLFDWKGFLERIHEANDAIYIQLRKVDYQFDGDTLHLYPQQKFTKNILEKSNNAKILTNCANGVSILVHEFGEEPVEKDETLSQISAIMGNVREVKGDMPF